jgi:predicted PurR-regulated permease PerM
VTAAAVTATVSFVVTTWPDQVIEPAVTGTTVAIAMLTVWPAQVTAAAVMGMVCFVTTDCPDHVIDPAVTGMTVAIDTVTV